MKKLIIISIPVIISTLLFLSLTLAVLDNNQHIIKIAKFQLDVNQNQQYNPKGAWWSISGGNAVIEQLNYTLGQDSHEKKTPGTYYNDILARNKKNLLILKDTDKKSGSSIILDFLDKNQASFMSYECKKMQLYYNPNQNNLDKQSSWILIGKKDMKKFTFLLTDSGNETRAEYSLFDCFPTDYSPAEISESSYENLKNLTSLETRIEMAE